MHASDKSDYVRRRNFNLNELGMNFRPRRIYRATLTTAYERLALSGARLRSRCLVQLSELGQSLSLVYEYTCPITGQFLSNTSLPWPPTSSRLQ